MRVMRHAFMIAAGAAIMALPFAGPATWASAARSASPAAPISSMSSIAAVACPTAKACVGVGDVSNSLDGTSAIIKTSTGAATAWSGEVPSGPTGIACPSTSLCLSAADDQIASVKVASGAMKVTDTPKVPKNGIVALGEIACATSTRCYAVGWEGPYESSTAIAIRLSGVGKQLALMKDAGTGIGSIACPSAARCLVSDASHSGVKIQILDSTRFGASHALPASTFIQRIACYKADVCYALGGKETSGPVSINEIFPLNPKTGAIGKMIKLSGFSGDGLTCASASRCLVVGFTGVGSAAKAGLVAIVHGKAGKATRFGPSGASYGAIACATATVCYATGQGSGSTGAIATKT